MSRHVCPKCNGEGYLWNRGQQIATGLLTLGMWPLMDIATSNGPKDSLMSRKCNACKGQGWVRDRQTPLSMQEGA